MATHSPEILFVDDEPQALKYAKLAFPEFRVHTASGPTEAKAVLAAAGSAIGIVVSDQRMPEGSGTDLLGWVHQVHPGVIRILTTAFSDLASAIEAVNTGAVYRYVVKPWQVDDLRQTLLRAGDLWRLHRERDVLLREKLTTLQRMVVADRVRSYAVLATGLADRIRNPLQGLRAFLESAPAPEESSEPAAGGPVHWQQLWDMARSESQRILEVVQGVVSRTLEPSFTVTAVDLAAVLQATPGIAADLTGLPPGLHGDPAMLSRMLRNLVERMRAIDAATEPRLDARATEVAGVPGVALRLTAPGRPPWRLDHLRTCLSATLESDSDPAFESGLLAAFFIAHHHGGTLRVHRTTPAGPGFEIVLPLDPAAARVPGIDPEWTERLFTWFEA